MQDTLIEKQFPVRAISVEAIREGGALAGHPPVNQLHVWWARRPLIAARATVAACMTPETTDKEAFLQMLGTSQATVEARDQMDLIKATGEWSDITFPNKRAFLTNPKIEHPYPPPVVLDVTAGGGSIPFEAGRLGLRSIANELNPVACLILRATCEWPQKYGYDLLDDYKECAEAFLNRVNELVADIYPDEPAPDCSTGNCPHPQHYRCVVENCEAFPGCSHAKIGSKDHEWVRAHRYAQTYLWARTVACPNCTAEIPLSPNWRLDAKGTGMRVSVDSNNHIALNIVHDRSACSNCKKDAKNGERRCNLATLHADGKISDGTVQRAIATCPACGSTTERGYLASEARAQRLGHRLYANVLRDSWYDNTKAGRPKKRATTARIFAEPEQRHLDNLASVDNEMSRLSPAWNAADTLPSEALPTGNKTKDATYYGMPTWIDMFNPRQQLAHGHCVTAFRECVDTDEDAGKLDEQRRAAWAYVAIALDKMLNRNSTLNVWLAPTGNVGNTFNTHDFGQRWTYAEMVTAGETGYGLSWATNDIAQCLDQITGMANHQHVEKDALTTAPPSTPAPPTEIINGNAAELPLPDKSVDCIVFDPPYHQNVCYAELADFFYVWLKRTAGYVFPEHFTQYLTEKEQEVIASPVRFKDAAAAKGKSATKLATKDYEQKMCDIFNECRRVITDDGIMTVMFQHKSNEAWEALAVALIDAKFTLVRTWPVKTESESSMHIKGKAAARSTILLVCRPREDNADPQPWQEVEALIAQAVQNDIRENLSHAGLKPVDLYLSAFGPALKVISENWGSTRETRNPDRPDDPWSVKPMDALQVARREVSRYRAAQISRKFAEIHENFTRFYILAKDACEGDTMLFDEANLLARAVGVPLAKTDADIKRIVDFKGDKVTLLSAHDRMQQQHIGEDVPAKTPLDEVQTAVALTNRRSTEDAKQWMANNNVQPDNATFQGVLESLIKTTKPGHDDAVALQNLWQYLYAGPPPKATRVTSYQPKLIEG